MSGCAICDIWNCERHKHQRKRAWRERMQKKNTEKIWKVVGLDEHSTHTTREMFGGTSREQTFSSYEKAAFEARRSANSERKPFIVLEAVKLFVPSTAVAEIGFEKEAEDSDFDFSMFQE